jgi:hypothetical protein
MSNPNLRGRTLQEMQYDLYAAMRRLDALINEIALLNEGRKGLKT